MSLNAYIAKLDFCVRFMNNKEMNKSVQEAIFTTIDSCLVYFALFGVNCFIVLHLFLQFSVNWMWQSVMVLEISKLEGCGVADYEGNISVRCLNLLEDISGILAGSLNKPHS